MTLSSGDCSPCRWALMFDDYGTYPDLGLVDLTPGQQESRGKELLRLLWEPVTPCAAEESAAAQVPCPPNSKVNFCEKNTSMDIDLVPSPCRHNCIRSQSDSACIAEFNEQLAVQDISDGTAGHSDIRPADTSQLQQVGTPQVLDLNACLQDSRRWDDAPRCMTVSADLSDVSTGTPDESVEDVSLNEVCDTALLGDAVIEDVPDVLGTEAVLTFMGLSFPADARGDTAEHVKRFAAQDACPNEDGAEIPWLASTGLQSEIGRPDHVFHSPYLLQGYVPTQQQSAFSKVLFHSHPVDQACTSSQEPQPCPMLSDDAWSSPWQWNTIITPTDCPNGKSSL